MRGQFLVLLILLNISLGFATTKCCSKITVVSYKASYSFWNFFKNKSPGRDLQPQIFGSYQAMCENGKQELINDRPVYRSSHYKGTYGMWFCGDSWYIGYYDERGNCSGFAHSGWKIDNCVENIRAFSWRVLDPENFKTEITVTNSIFERFTIITSIHILI